MSRKYKNDDTIYCPHCGGELEGTAEENVIPNRMGWEDSLSEGRCGECDEKFIAYREDIDTVFIEKE